MVHPRIPYIDAAKQVVGECSFDPVQKSATPEPGSGQGDADSSLSGRCIVGVGAGTLDLKGAVKRIFRPTCTRRHHVASTSHVEVPFLPTWVAPQEWAAGRW